MCVPSNLLRSSTTDDCAQCRVYVGETHNSSFAGGAPMRELAERIATSVGPSGPNKVRALSLRRAGSSSVAQEYLYRLCGAIRDLCPDSEDAYLGMLERLVREAEGRLRDRAGGVEVDRLGN